MAVIYTAANSSLFSAGFRLIAQTADTLPTTVGVVSAGDRAFITDGANKYFDGTSWAVETAEPLGSITVSSLSYQGFDVQTTVTRPANTTPYTAGDVLGGAIDLGVLGASAGSIYVNSVELEADIAAIPAGMTTFTMHLYNVTPPSALADNAAFDLPAGDRASYLGNIPGITMGDLGSTLYGAVVGLVQQMKLSGTHLFAYLQTIGGFTPAANSEVYKIYMHTTPAVF